MKYFSFTAGVLSLLLLSACTSTNQVSQPPTETTTQMKSQTESTQLEWLTSDKTFVTLTNLKYPKGFYIKPFEGENITGFDIDSFAGKMILGDSGVGCNPEEACSGEGLEIKISSFTVEPQNHTIEQGFLKKTSFPSIDKVDMEAFGKYVEKTADGVYFLPKEQYYFNGKNKTYEIQVWENNFKGPGTVDEIVQGVLASLQEDESMTQGSNTNTIGGFKVYVDQQKGKYVLDGGGTIYAELPITVSKDIQVEIFKETPYNVFIRTCPDGMGGYVLYGQCPGEFYMVNRSSKKVTNLTQKDLYIMDISSDESDATMIAWAKDKISGNKKTGEVEAHHQILIKNMAGKTVRTIDIGSQYFQYGDAKFSPDASKLVFAVAAGNPEKESGEVIVYDIEKQTSKTIDTSKDSYFHVKGWTDNNTVDYKKV